MKCIIIADKINKNQKQKHWYGADLVSSKLTLIDTQIKFLRKFFENIEIYYIYGFESHKVEQYLQKKYVSNFIGINNKEYGITGEINSIKQAIEYIDEDCLIIDGQNIINGKTFRNFINTNHLYTSSENMDDLGCRTNSMGKVQFISYGLEHSLANMYYIDKKTITLFRKKALNEKYKNYFIFEILNELIDQGIKYDVIKIKNNIHSS